LELRHLRYFIAVAEAGSFTRAGESLGIQQPPLSQQVKALEQELGFALFSRNPKGVALTVGGRVFLAEAQRLLSSLSRAKGLAASAATGTTGRFSLGFTTSNITHRLSPRLIKSFRHAYPDVEIEIHEGSAARLIDSIVAGRLDMCMVRIPVSRPPGVGFRVLGQERLLLIIPRGHALEAQTRANPKGQFRTLPLKAMKDEPFIFVRRPGGMGIYSELIDACARLGFKPRVAAEVENMLTNVALVAAGVGVSAVPASMQFVHQDDVLFLQPRESPQFNVPVTLAYDNANPNPAAQRFKEFATTFWKEEERALATATAGTKV
jgi:DNA-binding transcriptional LysR family regulator